MITLNETGLSELKTKSFEEAYKLKKFVSKITHKLYKGNNCTFWAEDETTSSAFKSLSEYKVLFNNELVSYGEMLCQILDVYAGDTGMKNIIVDNNFQWSNTWIYEECGVWIMTTNYFFTILLVTFYYREFPTEHLEKFAKEHGFSFDIQGEGENGIA